MKPSLRRLRLFVAAAVLLFIGMLLGNILTGAGNSGVTVTAATPDQLKMVLSEKLANVPGKTMTAAVVNYSPGGKTAAHHHAGSVFAYVLSGAIRSEVSTNGPVRIYQAGESFFEPPGSKHLVSENASTTEPASLLAIIIADDGATLTTFEK